jgi:hypothetical protein
MGRRYRRCRSDARARFEARRGDEGGMTPREQRELDALVVQAIEHKGSPYLIDACGAIATWFERRDLTEFEHQQERTARLVRLIRETAV